MAARAAMILAFFPARPLWHTRAMTGSGISRGVLAAALILAPALAGCGDSEKNAARAKKAAVALTDYYYQIWQPPSADWNVRRVKIDKDNTVTIEAVVVTKTLTKAIMERSKAEQMDIARMACPAGDAEVWKQVPKKQSVGVQLAGDAGHIINALCKNY